MPKSKVPNIQTKDNKIKHLRQQNNYEDVFQKKKKRCNDILF